MAGGSPAGLPATLKKAAAECGVDPGAVTVSVVALDGLRMPEGGNMPVVRPLLAVNADRLVSPASTAKLVTTLAGLELLGADWRWTTGFYALTRPDARGRVGGVWLRGGGDPTLVAEKFGMLVERMARMGVRRIEGDLTVDRSYFDMPAGDPAAFDGRGSRPYNLLPDAAAAGYRSLSFEFVPDEASGVARIVGAPALSGLEVRRRSSFPQAGAETGRRRSATDLSLSPTAGSPHALMAPCLLPAGPKPSAWCRSLKTNIWNASSEGIGNGTAAPGRDASSRGACPKAP